MGNLSRWKQALTITIMSTIFVWSIFIASHYSMGVRLTALSYIVSFFVYLLWKKESLIKLTPTWLAVLAISLVPSVSLYYFSSDGIFQLLSTTSSLLTLMLLPLAFLFNQHSDKKDDF